MTYKLAHEPKNEELATTLKMLTEKRQIHGVTSENAISEGEINVIAPEKCTECVGDHESSQCATICPVDACLPDPDHKESHEQLLEKWRKLHPGETPAYT